MRNSRVDAHAQIIVAAELTQQVNDEHQFLPMARRLLATAGAPQCLVADAGYWNTEPLRDPLLADLEVLVSPDSRRLDPGPSPPAKAPRNEDAQRMRARLSTPHGRARYDLRKQTVEPVFGQIKEIRRIRRFRFRGLPQVECEWKFICATHNLLKLFRCRSRLLPRARLAAAVASHQSRTSRPSSRQKRDFAPPTPICRCRRLTPPRRLYPSTSTLAAA